MPSLSPPSPARLRVRAAATADLHALAARVITAVRSEVTAYQHLHSEQVADIESIATWSLSRLLDLWTGTGDVEPIDRARLRNIGAARARDGRPIGDILRAYRVASARFIELVAGTYHAELEVTDIADLSIAVIAVLDEVTDAITEGHTTAGEHAQVHAHAARAELLDDMLAGRRSTAAALHDRCRQLGIRLPAQPIVLVVQRADGTAIGSDDAPLPWPDSWASEVLSTTRNGRAVHLLPPTAAPTLDEICARHGWHGCAIDGPSVSAIARSSRLADEAIDNAPGHAFVDRALLNLGDAQLLALIAARPTADPAETMHALLGPLMDRRQRHLLAALVAYLATGTAAAAAHQLQLHPQTLRYRLRRATELTGRDPQQPWHRMALSIAVQLLDGDADVRTAAGGQRVVSALRRVAASERRLQTP